MAADGSSKGAIAADHPQRRSLPVLVAPSTGDAFATLNTLEAAIVPMACFRLEAPRFAFDSSFITPDAAQEFPLLARLWTKAGKPPLSIFGHADPVGDDEYNKTLSGRRAQAVHALLVRDVDTWEKLYTQPFGSDDWRAHAVPLMLQGVGAPDVRTFQEEQGLVVDGVAGPNTRKALFLAYMDAICRDDTGAPFVLARTDFLGRGEDPDGKGDFQGCSELNPIRVFSQAEDQALASNKAERNAQNQPNRRVMIFLFPPGTMLTAKRWPCPTTKEPSSACKPMAWPDGDQRRACQSQRREYAVTHDTFACAFYDAMARRSPCEMVRQTLRLRLFDGRHEAISKARYRVSIGDHDVRTGKADATGMLDEVDVVAPSEVLVEWDFPAPTGGDDGAPFPFSLRVRLDARTGDDDAAIEKRLKNLGYRRSTLGDGVRAFKSDHGVTPLDDALDGATREKICRMHDEMKSKSELSGGAA
jgi:hypothetical protein